MATTYLEVCNSVLAEMNEVLLTDSNFGSATNIQLHTKNAVNKAYFDLNNPEYKWPWLSIAEPQNNYYGNVYVETVAGTRWYLCNSSSTGINDDYGHVDWEHFHLTEEGVAGKTAPYDMANLSYIELEEWRDHFAISEEKDKSNGQTYGIPKRVIRSPDGRRFGLSPIPKEVYRIYFWAWDRPVKLVNSTDPVVIPDQFVTVLESRARYYTWQRKENPQQAAIADQEYQDGLKAMRAQTIDQAPDAFTDTRRIFV